MKGLKINFIDAGEPRFDAAQALDHVARQVVADNSRLKEIRRLEVIIRTGRAEKGGRTIVLDNDMIESRKQHQLALAEALAKDGVVVGGDPEEIIRKVLNFETR